MGFSTNFLSSVKSCLARISIPKTKSSHNSGLHMTPAGLPQSRQVGDKQGKLSFDDSDIFTAELDAASTMANGAQNSFSDTTNNDRLRGAEYLRWCLVQHILAEPIGTLSEQSFNEILDHLKQAFGYVNCWRGLYQYNLDPSQQHIALASDGVTDYRVPTLQWIGAILRRRDEREIKILRKYIKRNLPSLELQQIHGSAPDPLMNINIPRDNPGATGVPDGLEFDAPPTTVTGPQIPAGHYKTMFHDFVRQNGDQLGDPLEYPISVVPPRHSCQQTYKSWTARAQASKKKDAEFEVYKQLCERFDVKFNAVSQTN